MYHDAHADHFNPFLISLEREDSGEGLWWGGRAGEDVPEVGAHIANDALGVGQNAELCVGGKLLPMAGLTLDPVDKHTVWSGMEQREVLVSYGGAYWKEFRKRKEVARLRMLNHWLAYRQGGGEGITEEGGAEVHAHRSALTRVPVGR